MNPELHSRLNQLQNVALAIGMAGIVGAVFGALRAPHSFFVSYLFAWLFWLGLSLGCLGVAMIHYLTGGLWGFATRRFLESGFLNLIPLAILAIPILFGLHDLYPWSRPEIVSADAILQKKHLYLNSTAFVARGIFYFAVWLTMAFCLRRWSVQQDATSAAEPVIRMRILSGPGIVIYPLTATFALVDWIMSMEPKWSSTIFPVIVIIGQILSALAFITLLLAWVGRQSPFREVATPKCFLDLGNLLLAFVMFWTYVSFAQFLIIYSGNLPREIIWYRPRIQNGWQWLVCALGLFHFLAPFFLLLFRTVKTNARRLGVMAALIFGAHALEMFWIVAPTFRRANDYVQWPDVACWLGIGGLWLAGFAWTLKRHPLLPQNDPRLEISLLQPAHAK
jgi:hypothetical protein